MASKANKAIIPGVVIWRKMQNRDGKLFYKLAIHSDDLCPPDAIVVAPARKLFEINDEIGIEVTIFLVHRIPGKASPTGDMEVVKIITAIILSPDEKFPSGERVQTIF